MVKTKSGFSLDDVRKIAKLVSEGVSGTKIATEIHRNKQEVLAAVRAIRGVKKKAHAEKCIRVKYRKPPLKVHCYRDGIVSESGNLYTGVNLYFIIHGDPSPREMDFFEAVQEWFENEIETNTGWAKSDDRYEKSSLSECDFDEVQTGRPRNQEQFIVEVSIIPDELIQYYAWYIHEWQIFRMWDDFRYDQLEKILRKRFK